MLLTGSEDTTVGISILKTNGEFKTINRLTNHIGSVRTISTAYVAQNEHLVITAGARYEANIYLLSTVSGDIKLMNHLQHRD